MEALKAMADALEVPVIASGGVSSLQDLHALKEIKHLGISGVIVGQALYTEKFTLNEALLAVKGGYHIGQKNNTLPGFKRAGVVKGKNLLI